MLVRGWTASSRHLRAPVQLAAMPPKVGIIRGGAYTNESLLKPALAFTLHTRDHLLQKRSSAASAADDASAKRPKASPCYYLMKSEAEVFSIDDLANCKNQTEPWDGERGGRTGGRQPVGCCFFIPTQSWERVVTVLAAAPLMPGPCVYPWEARYFCMLFLYAMRTCVRVTTLLRAGVRNHQAKKIMQGMSEGDMALFWASNTKQPGVVGVVQVSNYLRGCNAALHQYQ